MGSELRIGWSEVDITPENCVVELSGQYYQRVSEGIHSRIKAVALALSSGDTQYVSVCIDVVSIPEAVLNQVREVVCSRCAELRPGCITMNAIHTHNAPYLTPGGLFRDWTPISEGVLKPEDYIAFLVEKLSEVILAAWSKRAAGGIRRAFGEARIGHCRRAVYWDRTAEMYGDTTRDDFSGMESGEDSGVEMLFTYDKSGVPTGMVVNVACPSQVMESTYVISSDYMGATRERLKARFGDGFTTLCQISAAGCQSPRDLTRAYKTEPDFWHADGVEELSKRLDEAIGKAHDAIVESPIDYAPVMKHFSKRVYLPLRRASYLDYLEAKKNLVELEAKLPVKEAFLDFCRETKENEKIPGRPGPYDSKLHHFVLIKNNEAVVKRYEIQDETPNYDFEMQVLRLGDIAIVTNPFELFLDFGQMIKARAASTQTFVVQLAAGSGAGYLPTKRAERLGGYGGLIINGKVGSDGGMKLVDEAVSAIDSLFSET